MAEGGAAVVCWIQTVPEAEARGALKRQYQAAVKRAGRVFHVVSAMSLNPETLRASLGFYREAMFGDGPLSRLERELLATVVSATNGCFY
jgi:alkylhydroperoxidase family enzyme